jgi:hypothetical protein
MPSTSLTKAFNFSSDAQGWDVNAGTIYAPGTEETYSYGYNGSHGNPAGAMVGSVYKDNTDSPTTWQWQLSGTFNSIFGIPNSYPVYGVQVTNLDTLCDSLICTSSGYATLGPVGFAVGSDVEVLGAARTMTAVDSVWVSSSGSYVAFQSGTIGSTAVTFFINSEFELPPTMDADLGQGVVYWDNLWLQLTYEPNATGTDSGSSVDHPTIAATGTCPAPVDNYPYFQIIDNGGSGYTESGSGFESGSIQGYSGGYGGSERCIVGGGSGSNYALWSFASVPVGTYDVWATWYSGTGIGLGTPASNAPFTVYDYATVVGSKQITQVTGPYNRTSGILAGGSRFPDLVSNGVGWIRIGRYPISSGTLNVTLSDNANGDTIYDAIRILQVPTGCTLPTFTDIFDESSLINNIETIGTGTWSLDTTNHVLKQTNSSSGSTKALIADQSYSGVSTIFAKVRVDSWSSSGCVAGLSLRTNQATGQGINFLMHNSSGGITVGFYDESGGWSNESAYSITVGNWYWMKFLIAGTNTTLGKIWADGTQEPLTWAWYTTSATSRVAYDEPGLHGGFGGSTASFAYPRIYDDQTVFACGSLTVDHPTISASGVMVMPRSGSASLTVDHPTISGTGMVGRVGSGSSIFTSHVLIAASGLLGHPANGSASLTTDHVLISASGILLIPCNGTGSLVPRHSIISGTGSAPVTVIGSGSLTTDHPTLLATGFQTIPVYHGTGSLTKSETQFSGTGTYTLPTYYGTGFVFANHPTIIGMGINPPAAGGSVPMFVSGSEYPEEVGVSDLYVHGFDMQSVSVPMTTKGMPDTIQASVNIFVKVQGNPVPPAQLNMFVSSGIVPTMMTSLPVTVFGSSSGHTDILGGLPMVVFAEPITIPLNMYVKGIISGNLEVGLNMYVSCRHASIANSVAMMVYNNYQEIERSLKMYVEGTGVNPGYKPYGQSLGMYVQRGGYAGVYMMCCNTQTELGLDMYTLGAGFGSGNVNMALLNAYDNHPTKNLALYVSGFVPSSTSGSVNLSIPRTTALLPSSLDLFVRGFTYGS